MKDTKQQHPLREKAEHIGDEEQRQKGVLTAFVIHSDYLGCDPATPFLNQLDWAAHVVDFLLDLVYLGSDEERSREQDLIPCADCQYPFLTVCVRTDWADPRTGFLVEQSANKETPIVSDLLFTKGADGQWHAPGQPANRLDTLFTLVPPEFDEQDQELISMFVTDADKAAANAPYLPRYRFDSFIKFLLRWIIESLRVRLPVEIVSMPLNYGGDSIFTQWLTALHSAGWTREDFDKIHHALRGSVELTMPETKSRLLELFQSYHISTSPHLTAKENRDNINQKLTEIEIWIDANLSRVSDCKTNYDFMTFAVEIMNWSLYLLRVGVDPDPYEEMGDKGYTKHRAIIVGHMVRIWKLLGGARNHISRHELELAALFSRPIFETAMRMKYFINSKAKRKTFRSFILASYKPCKEILQDLKAKAQKRPLIQIEKRMKRKIVARLTKDGISQTELMNNTTWNVDGKHFRNIMKQLEQESMYSYGFGSPSDFIHGQWSEIDLHHLNRRGRYYTPNFGFTEPDPRIACSLTSICLRTLLIYLGLKWNKSDPDGAVTSAVKKLYELNAFLDAAHERSLEE